MMKWFLFFLLLLAAVLLEATLTTLPLVFVVLVPFGILIRHPVILVWSFVAGIVLDTLTFHLLGLSSMFFLLFFGVVFLYERKFEIQSIQFVLLFSFIGSLGYLFIVHGDQVMLLSLVSTLIAGGLFIGLQQVYKKNA